MIEYYGWVLAFISIIGAIINIFGNRWGFVAWIIANIGWVAFCIHNQIYEQIPIWIVFIVISCCGFFKWSKKEEKND